MIRVLPDLESLGRTAAELLVQQARQAISDHGRFSLVLSGGRTPRHTYELLSKDPFRDQLSWGQVHVFWCDERCVPPHDPRSNEHMARQALLDHVPIPAAQIHPIRCAQRPHEAAKKYQDLIRTFFKGQEARFDFVLLGVGENGHTASLFPKTYVLDERARWAVELCVDDQDLHRVTLTAPIINGAAMVAFLVTGTSKARALQEILEGPFDPHRLPAQLIHPASGRIIWLVDKEAAALLKHSA
jgi:6-phosphogluconolactonase